MERAAEYLAELFPQRYAGTAPRLFPRRRGRLRFSRKLVVADYRYAREYPAADPLGLFSGAVTVTPERVSFTAENTVLALNGTVTDYLTQPVLETHVTASRFPLQRIGAFTDMP
jgi:hypothetical protein